MRQIELINIFGSVSSIATSPTYTVNQASTVNVKVEGTTFKVICEASLDGVNFGEIGLLVNLKTGDVTKANGIITTDIYAIDLTGYCSFRFKVATGSITSMTGRLVD